MSFISQPFNLTAQDMPVTIEFVTAPPYYPASTYSWNITNFDSYVTYTLTTTNGAVSLAGTQIVYTPTTSGTGGFVVNGRVIPLTITPITEWIATLGGASDDYANKIAVDTSGNVYVCGRSNASGTNNFQIEKYNSSGTIQWQVSLGDAGNDQGFAIAVDASANVYVTGVSNDSGTNEMQIAKYDTAGAIQWQRRFGGVGSERGEGIAVDSSGNVYVVGFTGTGILVVKYNTSGTLQFDQLITSAGAQGLGIALDNSGNIYIVGYISVGGTEIFIAKLDSSGALLWQRRLGDVGPFNDIGQAIAVNSSGDVYITGRAAVAGNNEIVLAKYNTSGTLQWQRFLQGASTDTGADVRVDASGNVYLIGSSSVGGINTMQIAKYNSSGTIQFQRNISTTTNIGGQGITLDNAGKMLLTGTLTTVANQSEILIAQLPDDGSKTGTYTVGGISLTYAASTLTDTPGSLTSGTPTLAGGPSGLSSATTTLTSAATSLTSNITPV